MAIKVTKDLLGFEDLIFAFNQTIIQKRQVNNTIENFPIRSIDSSVIPHDDTSSIADVLATLLARISDADAVSVELINATIEQYLLTQQLILGFSANQSIKPMERLATGWQFDLDIGNNFYAAGAVSDGELILNPKLNLAVFRLIVSAVPPITYTITINGFEFSYSPTATSTDEEVLQTLADMINASNDISNDAIPSTFGTLPVLYINSPSTFDIVTSKATIASLYTGTSGNITMELLGAPTFDTMYDFGTAGAPTATAGKLVVNYHFLDYAPNGIICSYGDGFAAAASVVAPPSGTTLTYLGQTVVNPASQGLAKYSNYLFTIRETGSELLVFDTTNMDNATTYSASNSMSLAAQLSYFAFADFIDLLIIGVNLYVLSRDGQSAILTKVDISTPSAPVIVGASLRIPAASAMDYVGDTLFIVNPAGVNCEVYFVDINTMSTTNQIEVDGGQSTILAVGTTLLLGGEQSVNFAIAIVDVSNISYPVVSYQSYGSAIYFSRDSINGNFVFSMTSNGYIVLDITDVFAPFAQDISVSGSNGGNASGIVIGPDLLAIINDAGYTLNVYDISDPYFPVSLSNITSLPDSYFSPGAMVYSGKRLHNIGGIYTAITSTYVS